MEQLTLYQRINVFSIEKQNIWVDAKKLLHIKNRRLSKLKTARTKNRAENLRLGGTVDFKKSNSRRKAKNMRNKVKAILSAVLAVVLTAGFSFGALAADEADGEETAAPVAKNFAQTKLIAAGVPFGVKFHTDGVVVVGICGNCGPAADAGIKKGDVITAVDGKKVGSVGEFAEIIRNSNGAEVKLEYRSGGLERTATVQPIPDEFGEYKLGVWIKDSAAGIGTVTFIDPETKVFAGLGHGICDAESGALVPFAYGSAEEVALSGITPGRAGVPGELRGSFTGYKQGKLLKNTESGIYGVLSELPEGLSEELYPVGRSSEVKEGKAYIFTTVDGGGCQKYEIEISKIDKSGNGRNFSVRVTDKALLEKTGGIVQGMSGSPIIQNGKIIGAVTHVLVSNPTEGYGIFIENMLSELTEANVTETCLAA